MKKKSTIVVLITITVATTFLVLWLSSQQSRVGLASTETELVIGSIIPLTGAAADYGTYNREASELFVDDYNLNHPEGPILRHVFQDSKSKARDGINAALALFASNEIVAMQAQLSGVSVAVAPIVAERRIPLLTVAGTLRAKALNPLAYRNYPNPAFIAAETVRRLLAAEESSRVALLWSNDEFGQSVRTGFENASQKVGMRVVVAEPFEPGAADFRGTVSRVLANEPSIVYIAGVGNPIGRIIRQLRELGFEGQILGGPEIAFGNVLDVAGDAAEGVRFLDLDFNIDAQRPETQNFVRRYREKFDRDPTAVSAVVYDGWSLIMAAVGHADSSDPDSVAAALANIGPFEGVVGTLTVNVDRDVVYPLTARVIQGGKASRLEEGL